MTRFNENQSVVSKPNTFYEHQSHQATLLEGLNALRQKNELFDISLVIQGRIFKAHKAVLAACSDYFHAMFTDNMLEARQEEIHLNGITAKGFHQILEYAYTSRLLLNLGNVQDVLEAASHVQMVAVIQACSDYLQVQIDLDNCVDVATIAETYSLLQLRMKVYRYMSENLIDFFNSKEFYRLSGQQLENLLACDFPVDCSETDVLRIVLSWFFQSESSKANHRVSPPLHILRYIHFEEISHRKLHTLLDKQFQERHSDYDLYEIILSEAYLHTTSTPRSPLVNSRGMEQAVLKIGGFGLAGITNEITYCFSSERKWKHLTTIPHLEQCNFGTAVLNNELYIVGGCFNQSLQENIHPFGFKYNPRYDKWSTMSPMQIERCRFSLNVVGDMLYAVGGASESDELDTSTCERYDPAVDMWSSVTSLPAYFTQHAGAAYGNSHLFVSGGMDRDSVQSHVFCYVLEEGRWRECTPMLKSRADHTMLTIGERLYVCGGWSEGPDFRSRLLVDTIDAYDVKEDRWEVVTKVPTPRYHAGIVSVDRMIYFIGGFSSEDMFDKSTAAIECYDIDRDRWTSEEKYPQDIWEHTCATLFIPRWRDDMQDMQVIAKDDCK